MGGMFIRYSRGWGYVWVNIGVGRARGSPHRSGHGAHGHGTSGWLPVSHPDLGRWAGGAAAHVAAPPGLRPTGSPGRARCAPVPAATGRRFRANPPLHKGGPQRCSAVRGGAPVSLSVWCAGGPRARRPPAPGTLRARPWHVRVAAGEPRGPRPGAGRRGRSSGCAARPQAARFRRAVRVVPRCSSFCCRANPPLHKGGPQRCSAVRGGAPVSLSVGCSGGPRARRPSAPGTLRARPWHVRVAAGEPRGPRPGCGRRGRSGGCAARPRAARFSPAVRVVPRCPPSWCRANPPSPEGGPQRFPAVRGGAPVSPRLFARLRTARQSRISPARSLRALWLRSPRRASVAVPSRDRCRVLSHARVPRGCAALPGPRRASAV